MPIQREIHHRPPNSSPRFALAGDVYQVLVSGDQTGGRYAVVSGDVPPGGGPPEHVHSRENEGFYILEGELTFYAQGKSFTASPGSVVNLTPGIPHRFRNESNAPVRVLLTVSPAGWEKMVEELGTILQEGEVARPPTPAEIARLLEVAPRYGITITSH